MKIIIGMLHHETNTLTPLTTGLADFDVSEGEQMLERVAVTQCLREAGAEVIPTIYASAVPSGRVEASAYSYFADRILGIVRDRAPVDGIWLHLHGAMDVEGIGSGEADLAARIRKIVGDSTPMAVALDFHANICEEFVNAVNVVCGYRTAPHVDQDETQIRAARLLLESIKSGKLPRTFMIRVPVLTPGDILVTTSDPGRSLMAQVEGVDSKPGVICASIFGGQPWVDAPNVSMSVVMSADNDSTVAREEALRLAKSCWDARTQLRFEAEVAEPRMAIAAAMEARKTPVFISDSGDNITGGAPGDSALMLKLLTEAGAKRTLVAGITDPEVVSACADLHPGDSLDAVLGGKLDPKKSQSMRVTGTLKTKGSLIGWLGGNGGPAVVLEIGGIDVLVTQQRCGIVSPKIVRSAGVDCSDYDLIVVKLGYLWDALAKVARHAIIALTPGATCEDIASIEYHHVSRPIYPLDKDFDWNPRL